MSEIRSGFTLIELIIVVGIIMLVTGSGIAAYLQLNERQTLLSTGKDIQSYMRAAQKRARSGDKPSGCDTLRNFSVTAASGNFSIVQIQAECDSGNFVVDSFTIPNGIAVASPIAMKFLVLKGGVSGAGTVTLTGARRSFTFTVDSGGQIGEGTLGTNAQGEIDGGGGEIIPGGGSDEN